MSLKDQHASRLTHLCALPRNHPNLVAYRLQEIFGTIGYPKIFHTDNGKEFTAKSILEFLRQLNPNILAVTGQPRCPRDQGSVENVNALVKRVLGSVLAERRQSGENPNWTKVLGSMASIINSQCGRGKYDVSAYDAVFGQVYNHPLSCSKAEARCCWTIKDQMNVTYEPDFDVYVKENFIVQEDDKEEDRDEEDRDEIEENKDKNAALLAYFSDEELSQKEMDEVSDEYFYEHLFDDVEFPKSQIKSPPEDIKPEEVPPSQLKSPPEYIQQVHPSQLKSPPENIQPDNFGHTDFDIFDEAQGLGQEQVVTSPTTFSPVDKSDCSTGICFGPNCVE
jgi:hypothetical protein